MRLLTIEFSRLAAMLSIAFLLVAFGGTDAWANTALCASLKSQLASMSGGGNSAQYNRYNEAYQRQLSELAKTERMAQRGGCARSNSDQCRTLSATIAKMKSNAAKLNATRNKYAGASSSSRAVIERKLKANRCDEQRQVLFPRSSSAKVTSVRRVSTGQSTTQKEAGVASNRVTRSRSSTIVASDPDAPATLDRLTDGYRTVCVRTCDGYFFPVSFSATKPDFKRDQMACNAMCPGTEVKIFAHRVPEEETEAMVDAKGSAYISMPNAFAYLKPNYIANRPQSCTCRAASQPTDGPANQTPVPPGLLQAVIIDKGVKTVLPAVRPDIHADPETMANGAGGFTLAMIGTLTNGLATGDAIELVDNQAVRVVLPKFLPDPATAIDLRAQDPISVQ